MLVDVHQDPTGSVVLTPVSEKVRRQMRRHMKEMTGHPYDTIYLQEWRGDEFLDERVPSAKRTMVRTGYTQTIRMDPWEFGMMAGYDFHEAINP